VQRSELSSFFRERDVNTDAPRILRQHLLGDLVELALFSQTALSGDNGRGRTL
jgi:hypothetical protein